MVSFAATGCNPKGDTNENGSISGHRPSEVTPEQAHDLDDSRWSVLWGHMGDSPAATHNCAVFSVLFGYEDFLFVVKGAGWQNLEQ